MDGCFHDAICIGPSRLSSLFCSLRLVVEVYIHENVWETVRQPELVDEQGSMPNTDSVNRDYTIHHVLSFQMNIIWVII